ncbi:VanZ family protein [Prevotella herbatica]|nr:VanZ family protein [Prevotella herbatica]
MNILFHSVTKHPFSSLCVLIIWILCFIPIPETPLDKISMIDKWTHIVMYGGTCGVIWLEHLAKYKRVKWNKIIIWALLAPILMGGLIEILQKYCTGGMRSGEWLDFAADTIGVGLAFIIGSLLAMCFSKV